MRRQHPAQRVGEVVPLARHEVEVEPQQREHQQHEAARKEHVGQRDGAGEEGVGPPERHAEEQVAMQQLHVPGLLRFLPAPQQGDLGDVAAGSKELVMREELHEMLDFLSSRL